MVLGRFDNALTKLLFWDEVGRHGVSSVDIILEGCGPQGRGNGGRPAVGSMKESSSGSLCDVFDAIFSFAILVVSIDATEGEILLAVIDGSAESFGIEEAIVGVIIGNGDVVSFEDSFEGAFGFHGCFGVHFGHEVDVGEVGEVVNKNCGADVALESRSATVGGNKAKGATF